MFRSNHHHAKQKQTKKPLIFQEMELSSSSIKIIPIFPERKPCTIQPQLSKSQSFSLKKNYFFLKESTLKKFCVFSQTKSFLIFPEMEPCTFLHAEEILYTLRNRNLDKFLLFSQKKAVLMFREVTFRA